jgi:hypothetical protein
VQGCEEKIKRKWIQRREYEINTPKKTKEELFNESLDVPSYEIS